MLRRWAVPTLVLALASCSGSKDGSDPAFPGTSYSGRQTALFDDSIEPAAVGLDFDRGYSPRADKALRERVRAGDAVLRVKVQTVTAKTDEGDRLFQLGLHSVEKLAGKNPPPSDFTVEINKKSESHGIMKSFDSRLVGYAFVAFVRDFVVPSGEHELHFHLAPDTKDVRAAVGDAMLVGEVK